MPCPARRFRLSAEVLEARDNPVAILFDYSLDTSGFFTDPTRRATLEQAAATIAPRLTDSLAAIVPGGGNTWTASFANPAVGGITDLPNLTIPSNTLLVFVNAANVGFADELGIASTGFSVAGDGAWVELVSARGQPGALANPATDYAPWGGLITFSGTTNWHFGSDPPPGDRFDFFSVATHELLHIFGFGASDSFNRNISGTSFVGPNATAVFGGPVPLNAGLDHFLEGTRVGGQIDPMVPAIGEGERRPVSSLDLAALRDIGWEIATNPSFVSDGGFRPPPAGGTAPGTLPGGAVGRFTIGSGAGVPAAAFTVTASGVTAAPGVPFGTFAGGVRVATADVTGDGVPDTVYGTGPGVATQVVVFNGATGGQVAQKFPFESTFTGGVYVAAGDLNGDGRADLVVTPDEGGGPRVLVFDGATGNVLADFLGIDDPNFRGGARAALGDIDGDGRVDLVIAAGFGGGPRVAIFNGRTVPGASANAPPSRLLNDFFVFEDTLRNGAFVAAADLNGDGFGDLIAGGGPGGGPRVTVFGGAQLLGNQAVQIINFFAGDDSNRGGVYVAAVDVDADGWPDLITGDGPVTTAGASGGVVRVYASGDLLRNTFDPWLTYTDPSFVNPGVFVG
jgi:hypothetical protein